MDCELNITKLSLGNKINLITTQNMALVCHLKAEKWSATSSFLCLTACWAQKHQKSSTEAIKHIAKVQFA